MFIEERIAIEDAKAERDFLESIGTIGRILDDHLMYGYALAGSCSLVFSIAFLVGRSMWPY
jgi:hypothetical protein